MKLINRYDKKEHEYKILTLEEIKNLSGHAEIISNKGDVVRVKINGKVKTWKKDVSCYSVPVKFGLYETTRIDETNTTNIFVREL